MDRLRQIIKEELILEKRIAQIKTSFEVDFFFDINRTAHAVNRTIRTDSEDYNDRPIMNREIKEVINLAKRKIAEKIVNQEIMSGDEIVIKSLRWEMAIAITPIYISKTYWELIIKTVFRESKENPFRVSEDQVVINIDN